MLSNNKILRKTAYCLTCQNFALKFYFKIIEVLVKVGRRNILNLKQNILLVSTSIQEHHIQYISVISLGLETNIGRSSIVKKVHNLHKLLINI